MSDTVIPEAEARQIIKECDDAVKHHSASSLILSKALMRVRDSGAYMLTHQSFDAFALEKYDIEKRRVFQLLSAAQTMTNLEAKIQVNNCAPESPKLTDSIKNEGQARALAAIPEEKQLEVLETLVEAGMQITAEAIRVAGAALESNEKAKPKSPPKKNADLLEHVQEAFNRRHEFEAIIGDLIGAYEKAQHLKKTKLGEFIQIERFGSILENAKAQIAFAKPWADCVACQQRGCKLCHQTGWLNKDLFRTLTLDLQAMSVVKGKA